VKIISLNYLASNTAEKFIVLYSPRFKGVYMFFFFQNLFIIYLFS